ncbi:MAG: primosomal protein N' [Patescibacteria group bacterium]
MKAIEVIPLEGNIFRDSLSYFTAKPVMPGAMIEITVRQKKVKALVVAVREVAEVKSKLRRANFSLKKIEKIENENLLRPEFIEAVTQTATYYAGYAGQILKNLIPKAILENLEAVTSAESAPKTNLSVKSECLVLQQPLEERLVFYKSLVREEFARSHSVFIICPTTTQVQYLKKILDRGIKEYTYALSGTLPVKKTLEAWNQILNEKHPVLIIATPSFLALPRHDLKTIIIDDEGAESYKSLKRPYFSFRYFTENLSQLIKAKLILGADVLSIETMYAFELGKYQNAATVKNRAFTTAHSTVLDIKSRTESPQVQALNEKLLKKISEALANNEKIFIWSARRGLAPIVVCQDCGRAVLCLKCLMPVTLHRENIFICHHCHETRSSAEFCGYCQSWNLLPLGIGAEKVADRLKEVFPTTSILQIDSDHTPNRKEAQTTLEKFLTSGGILVGTEMAVGLLQTKVENIFIASLDAIMSLPEFKISEKVFTTLLKLRALAIRQFIIQTRNPDWPFFELAISGNIMEFYRQEIRDRERFDYPPFKLLIKISRHGTQTEVLADVRRLEKVLKDYNPDIFESTGGVAGEYVAHAIIKQDPKTWPEKNLLTLLYALPPVFRIEVDPQTLL